jgi:hypothetical protein
MDRRRFVEGMGAMAGTCRIGSAAAQADRCDAGAAPCVSAEAEADWGRRSRGAGVVWAHDFRHAGEVAAHLKANQSGGVADAGPALHANRVADGPTGHCMQFVALGARLARDFGVGESELLIDDDTLWPGPPFYVHVTDRTRTEQNNVFLCTARSGRTLTVVYQPQFEREQPCAASRRSWAAGSHIGHQSAMHWVRVFSALTGDSNGIGIDDVNASRGPIRSRVRGNPRYVPHSSIFGYGWYGRPEYQAQFAKWNPSQHGRYPIDEIERSNLWDGDEFYIQFRLKIDPRYWELNTVDPRSESTDFSRKIWMLQAEMTVPQQITAVISPSNRYLIPSTRPSPFYMAGYSFGGGLAGRLLTTRLDGGGSFQPGSRWSSTAVPGSNRPAGSAWEYVPGEWVTFLLRVKPGLDWVEGREAAARNTVVEVKMARPGESQYTTLFSMPDQAIVFGSSGPQEHAWRTALPGYNAFVPTGYLNIELGNVPPKAAYYVRWAQIIFSKEPVPAPSV